MSINIYNVGTSEIFTPDSSTYCDVDSWKPPSLTCKKEKILKLSVEKLPLMCVFLQGLCFEFIPVCIPFTNNTQTIIIHGKNQNAAIRRYYLHKKPKTLELLCKVTDNRTAMLKGTWRAKCHFLSFRTSACNQKRILMYIKKPLLLRGRYLVCTDRKVYDTCCIRTIV
jgi:hypothetical protein